MDFKALEKLVITGHDIEFEYDNNKYSIVKGPGGFYFTNMNKQDTSKIYSNALELLIKANINGKTLKDLSKNMKNIQVY